MIKRLLGLIYGALWGMAHIVPGLSGGTLLVIFGCYDTVCQAFALNFKEIKKHIIFFILFGIGAVAGVVGFIHAVMYMFEHFNVQTNLFFMGLIIGGIPLILRLAREDEKISAKCLFPFLLGLIIVLGFFFIDKFGLLAADAAETMSFATVARLVIGAFVAAIAMVVPGISGASILIAVGIYEPVMEAVKSFDFTILIPAGVGLLLGIVLGAKAIIFLLKKSKLLVYSAILGMVIGSAVPLFPDGFGLNIVTLIGFACLLAGAALSWVLGRQEKVSD